MVAYDRASAPLQLNWMLSSTSMRCWLSTPARFAMRCTLHLQGSRTQSVPAVEPWVRVPTAWAQPTALASRVPGTGAASCCHEPIEGLLHWCSSWSDLAEAAPAPMCRSAAHFVLEHMHAEVTCADRASADRRNGREHTSSSATAPRWSRRRASCPRPRPRGPLQTTGPTPRLPHQTQTPARAEQPPCAPRSPSLYDGPQQHHVEMATLHLRGRQHSHAPASHHSPVLSVSISDIHARA